MMPPDIGFLYSEYGKFVYNIALRMLYNRTDAEDVMQEVFIKLQEKAGSFKGNSSIKTFMYRITANQCIDLIRKQRSLAKRAEASAEVYRPASQENSMLLDSLLQTLSEKHRAVVLLYEIAGCSQKEISAAMNMSTGTIKSILSRSITKMAGLMEKEAANALHGN
jgi:RNA polymerase sigma-70 factor, ECF subfamily